MSSGEQQMVAIGRPIMARPPALLVDEPSLSLAPLLVASLFSVLREINRAGVTVLLVEQNVRHAPEISHRGYVLKAGRVVLEGPAKGLVQHNGVGDGSGGRCQLRQLVLATTHAPRPAP